MIPFFYSEWKIKQELGRGSYGTVYEIEEQTERGPKRAALKVISVPKEESEIQTLRDSGQSEAQITAYYTACKEQAISEFNMMNALQQCKNVVRCEDIRANRHDAGIGWDIYIKMELLKPLASCLDRLVSEEEILRFGEQMSNALSECRKHRIVHRDIKPQNILVAEDGTYKLGDFGVAKAADTIRGERIGTYNYMAPEVYLGEEYGAAADRYSLGMVLYWLLNEHRGPFLPLPPEGVSSEQGEEARKQRFSGKTIPEPIHGSKELKALVLRLCDYDKKNRLANAEELKEALHAIRTQDYGALERILRKPIEEASADADFERRAVTALPPIVTKPFGVPNQSGTPRKYHNLNGPEVDTTPDSGGSQKYHNPNGPKIKQGQNSAPDKYQNPNGPEVESPTGDPPGKYQNPNGPEIEQPQTSIPQANTPHQSTGPQIQQETPTHTSGNQPWHQPNTQQDPKPGPQTQVPQTPRPGIKPITQRPGCLIPMILAPAVVVIVVVILILTNPVIFPPSMSEPTIEPMSEPMQEVSGKEGASETATGNSSLQEDGMSGDPEPAVAAPEDPWAIENTMTFLLNRSFTYEPYGTFRPECEGSYEGNYFTFRCGSPAEECKVTVYFGSSAGQAVSESLYRRENDGESITITFSKDCEFGAYKIVGETRDGECSCEVCYIGIGEAVFQPHTEDITGYVFLQVGVDELDSPYQPSTHFEDPFLTIENGTFTMDNEAYGHSFNWTTDCVFYQTIMAPFAGITCEQSISGVEMGKCYFCTKESGKDPELISATYIKHAGKYVSCTDQGTIIEKTSFDNQCMWYFSKAPGGA